MTPKTRAALSIAGNGLLILGVGALFLFSLVVKPIIAVVLLLLVIIGILTQRQRDHNSR